MNNTLRLKAPKGAELTLFSQFDEGEEILSRAREENGEFSFLTYDLAPGNYRVSMKCEGFLPILQFLSFSQEELENGAEFTLPAEPAGNGEYEAGFTHPIRYLSPKMKELAVPDGAPLWEDVLPYSTPYFTTPRRTHQATSHEEMLAFLDKLSEENPRLKRFELFRSPVYGLSVPIIIFSSTDLSHVKTLREAATLLRTNGRPVVHIQAQIHGNESAAGEAVLAIVEFLGTVEGQKLLENIDVYVIPRLNPDGAREYIRENVAQKANMNRDFINLTCLETTEAVRAFRLFMPEILIDCHEYTGPVQKVESTYYDMMISRATDLNGAQPIHEASLAVIYKAFDQLRENGLRSSFYLTRANGTNSGTGTKYAAQKGAIPFLVESRGNQQGMNHYRRRVAGQFITVRTILEEIASRPVFYRELIAEERLRLSDSTGRSFVLKSQFSKDPATGYPHPSTVYHYGTGQVIDTPVAYGFDLDQILRSRPLPHAYVLPAGEAWEEEVVTLFKKHGIAFRKDDPRTSYTLTHYCGNGEEATISPKRRVTFPQGCYFIPVNQVSSTVLACLVEPDVNDGSQHRITLVQRGIIVPGKDGSLPIYRLEP